MMRVTDEMVDAAIAADFHASWWAGNNREGAEKRMRSALEAALAVEGTEAAAWQRRILYPSVPGAVPEWQQCKASEATDRFARVSGYEYRPLYTTPPAGIREALEVIESFIAETVDYATRNNLGDPEKQHNVKWGRKVLAALRGQS